ncbi:MAG: hypothetical protein KGL35_03335 [Bradyrhizobium sp.]|nr:hypothetical protein [Bradyrhizobium sp.]
MPTQHPIPDELYDEFDAYMEAHNNHDLPDGAWFQCLQDAAEKFIELHGIQGADALDATHQYLWTN